MLLTTVFLWALNLSVTRYILTHGLEPLSYATVRYGLAAAIFVGMALVSERSLRVRRRDLPLLGLAAAISFVGVAFVAAGASGQHDASVRGIVLGLCTAATWAAYSVTVAPLMRTYSPTRMSAVVIPATWVLLALSGLGETSTQDWHVGWQIWPLLLLATIGPLVLTNVLWFRSIHRIGANRATLAANLQPFVAALLAVVLLSESIGPLQLLGGLLIALGLVVVRRRPRPSPQAA
jgi:drug/metabolite transporter (DMT)-like permease